jgi:hypothetical protein
MSIPRYLSSSLVVPAFLSIALSASVLDAQRRSGADSVYSRAVRLVAEGRGDAGRALVDSMVRVVPQGSGDYAEALFWRASTSKRAEDAERDYLRIVIEYPLSPRSEEALIRLAEMEMLRGDRTRAQRHLQRLVIEHPGGTSRAKASYWLARIFFEANEVTRGCHELNVARSRASATDVELRNQLDYQAQRCAGVAPTPVVAAVAPTAAPETTQSTKAAPRSEVAPRAPAESVLKPTPGPQQRSASSAATAGPSPIAASATAASATSTSPSTAPPSTVPPATPSQRTASTTAPPPPAAAPYPAAPPSTAPLPASETPSARERGTATRTFTVQVAAFPTREAAVTFMESLRARGYDVRVWGGETPFRVRVGRYATRDEASAMAAELRAKMISRDAWVTETEVR